uniref:Uncharacterized protein AlNc14C241G9469 n=1 Tax=Albugo laibachii Nc14 TaxID=890382 RepID=F0WSY0_9STRA|nr:conserved hypothetical protein [Albugo laibachii Nc14]|eukprot:CCA24464.1 conserved hypothetical protein [Albugo laibachii Nc14]
MSAFKRRFEITVLLSALLVGSGSVTLGDESGRILSFSNRKGFFHATDTNSRPEMSTFDLYKIIQESIGFGGFSTNLGQSEIGLDPPLIADVFEKAQIQGLIHIEGDFPDILSRIQSRLKQQESDLFSETHALTNTEYNKLITQKLIKGASHEDSFHCSDDGNVQICDESGTELAIENEQVLEKKIQLRDTLGKDLSQGGRFAEELAQIELVFRLTPTKRLFFIQLSSLKSLKPEDWEAGSQILVEALTGMLIKSTQESNVISVHITTGQVEKADQKENITAFARRRLLTFEDLAGSSPGNDSSHQNHTASEITLEEIANFQIVLWTAIFLALILYGVIYAMLNLSTTRDSLLHVKFIANTSHRKTD